MDKFISVRVPEETKRAFFEEAHKRGMSPSALVRKLIERELNPVREKSEA